MNRRSDNVTKGAERAPNRSLFYAMGYTKEELEKPLIGVVSAHSEIVPGHIHLDKIAEAVKAGMFAKSEFKYLQKENTISLNKTSVVEKNGKHYVFVIKDKNKVEQRAIKTGIRNDTQVEITSGINEGETIVIDNLSRLRNGVTVEVQANEDGKL